jgi:hypothetical protein
MANSKPVKQEINSTVILPPLVVARVVSTEVGHCLIIPRSRVRILGEEAAMNSGQVDEMFWRQGNIF